MAEVIKYGIIRDRDFFGFLESGVDRALSLSGPEIAHIIKTCCSIKADVYMFDEPSSYLDIYQRLKIARIIRRLSETKKVVVIEHDLAVLDFLADMVYMLYGSEGAYGIVAHPRGVRQAINTYLSGMLREENIRFRDSAIEFDPRPPRETWESAALISFEPLEKSFKRFTNSWLWLVFPQVYNCLSQHIDCGFFLRHLCAYERLMQYIMKMEIIIRF